MDPVGMAILTLIAALWIFWPIAFIDAARRPTEHWTWAGRSKPAWMVALLVFGVVAGCVYWLSLRPALREAKRVGVAHRPRPKAPRRKDDWGDPWEDEQGA